MGFEEKGDPHLWLNLGVGFAECRKDRASALL